MNVVDVMSAKPSSVCAEDHLDQAARILWEQDCGFVPVMDADDLLVGVVTDRDLCMASYSQVKPVASVAVEAVMTRELTTCQPGDTVAEAMAAMASAQVHRVPVIDANGVLVGVLSLSDLVQLAAARPSALPAKQMVATIAAVTKPRRGGRNFVAEAKSATPPRKKAAAKKEVAKQDPAKQDPAKQDPAKKDPAKKGPAKKGPAKKAAAKKAAAKKAAPKKAAPSVGVDEGQSRHQA